MARVMMIGWARMAIPASVGTGVSTMSVWTTAAALFLATMWFAVASWAEENVDRRFGIMLGHVAPRRLTPLLDVGDPGHTFLPFRGRHARARRRGRNLQKLP